MSQRSDLLQEALTLGVGYLENLDQRTVAPDPEALAALRDLDEPFPAVPTDPEKVLADLDRYGSPSTVATTGGRYYGFVTGGALPVAQAAAVLATAWDQNAGLYVLSPISAVLEQISSRWILEALELPAESGVGFVTGGSMANFTCLAAARNAQLTRAGWDVESRGLFGAPELTVVVGEELHISLSKSLSLLGLGRDRVIRIPTDEQGRMRADAIPDVTGLAIFCIQAGNVNTGAFDPAEPIIAKAKQSGAWVHVDGAFGLWATLAPARAHLTRGFEAADSWATDAHKWLNVTQDSGLAIVRDPEHLISAMSANAAYLVRGSERDPNRYTPELSRRARGVELWAVLKSLGRAGLAELIESNCRAASRFAEKLRSAGLEILNEVALNQTLVFLGDEDRTRTIIAAIQKDGTCWCGGTVWHGRPALRISVSSWATTDEDVDRSADAIIRAARG
jgi:glutamate/tyrosine decarboxylase-like PLP-dependent enzyme